MAYKLILGWDGIKRLIDGASIANDPLNKDWIEYQAWVAQGNTPEAADPPPPPSEGELAVGGVKQWLLDNPAVMQIVNMSPAEIEADATTLVNALFPVASGANKNRTIKLWTLWTLHARMTIKERL